MVSRIFIYGKFLNQREIEPPPLWLGQTLTAIGLPHIEPELSPVAIEILREPSVLELIGKVYALTSSRNYHPVTPLGVRNFDWYREYESGSANKEGFYFKAKQGDLWRVPWMRQESDDAGAYIAVALKHD